MLMSRFFFPLVLKPGIIYIPWNSLTENKAMTASCATTTTTQVRTLNRFSKVPPCPSAVPIPSLRQPQPTAPGDLPFLGRLHKWENPCVWVLHSSLTVTCQWVSHSFSSLSGIPLYGYMVVLFICSPNDGTVHLLLFFGHHESCCHEDLQASLCGMHVFTSFVQILTSGIARQI